MSGKINIQTENGKPVQINIQININQAPDKKTKSRKNLNPETWSLIKEHEPAIYTLWQNVAARVPIKSGNVRASTAYDCFQIFKGILPPIGDGVSQIPRPTKEL